jgi:hypothetical protein
MTADTAEPGTDQTRAELVRAVDRLVDQVGHWTSTRWATPAGGGPAGQGGGKGSASGAGSRADVVHALAQRLADLEAAVAGRPTRAVPRLENDLVLPDQVRVTALDLLAASPPGAVLAEATTAVTQTRASF